MELEILKKKISTYRTTSGKITRVSDELAMEILIAWEQWTGPAKGFYAAIGAHPKKMASIIGRAKQLKRDGHFPEEAFKEIKVEGSVTSISNSPCIGIEVCLGDGKVIRFPEVQSLVDFLKKVA